MRPQGQLFVEMVNFITDGVPMGVLDEHARVPRFGGWARKSPYWPRFGGAFFCRRGSRASAAPKSEWTTCFGSAPSSITMKTVSIQLFFQYRSW
jgi:hypothetical protein